MESRQAFSFSPYRRLHQVPVIRDGLAGEHDPELPGAVRDPVTSSDFSFLEAGDFVGENAGQAAGRGLGVRDQEGERSSSPVPVRRVRRRGRGTGLVLQEIGGQIARNRVRKRGQVVQRRAGVGPGELRELALLGELLGVIWALRVEGLARDRCGSRSRRSCRRKCFMLALELRIDLGRGAGGRTSSAGRATGSCRPRPSPPRSAGA